MEQVTVILLIPALGLALRLQQHWLDQTLDVSERGRLRMAIRLCGWALQAVGAGILFLAGRQVVEMVRQGADDWDGLILCLRLVVALATAVTGRLAVRMAGAQELRDAPLKTQVLQAREWERLTILSTLLVAAPLLLFSGWLIFLAPLVAVVDYAIQSLVVRGRQNRLLWTLAVAAQHHRPFPEEIEFLAETERPRVAAFLYELAGSLRRGTPLSRALMAGPRLLDREIAAELQVAEERDQLPEALREIALRHTRKIRFFRWEGTLGGLLVYTFGVCLATIFLTGFVMYYIVPKYKVILEDFGVPMPAATRQMIALSDFFVGNWYWLLPLGALPAMAFLHLLYASVGQARWVPSFLRAGWPRHMTPFVLRSLSRAAEQQGSMIRVMESLSATTLDSSESSRLSRIGERLAEGDALGPILHDERLVNFREAQALSAAEQLGHLPWALSALGQRIEDGRVRRFGQITEVLRPLVILALGGVVLTICYAWFVPLTTVIEELS